MITGYFMRKFELLLLATLGLGNLAQAQDSRDDEIFGDTAKPSIPAAADKSAKADGSAFEQQSKALMDTLQIGGRLEIRSLSSQKEQQRLQESGFAPSKTADIYFDTRPTEELRVFLRTRLTETQNLVTNSQGQTKPINVFNQQIDELWFKWDLARTVFLTYGKQQVKWGSGTLWNPTDFTSSETRDPLDLFDRRLGRDMLKIHIPNEKMGFNYYAILQFNEAARTDDIGLALRGEFAFLGMGELALSAQTRRGAAQKLGLDVSSALGPIDVKVEAAGTKRQDRTFYRDGLLESDQLIVPTAYKQDDKLFKQIMGGVQYAVKYSDDDSIYFGGEYFYNELGYQQRLEEIFSLLLGQSQSLYAGQRYAGGYIRLPNPGSWNKTSFFLTALSNLSDETSIARLTGTWSIANYASFETYISRCAGEYGELCFKVPQNLKDLAASPDFDPVLKKILSELPTERTLFTAGVGLSINF